MTSYLATIRFEADGDRQAWMAALCAAAAVTDLFRPDREAAVTDVRFEDGRQVLTKRAAVDPDEPSDLLVERVAKRLAERRLMPDSDDPTIPGADGPIKVPTLNPCTGRVVSRWCGLPAGHAGGCQ